MSTSITDDYFTEDELTAYLGYRNTVTLARWRKAKRGPAWIRLGHRVLYRKDGVRAWLAAQEGRAS
jgi:hypothetical protein